MLVLLGRGMGNGDGRGEDGRGASRSAVISPDAADAVVPLAVAKAAAGAAPLGEPAPATGEAGVGPAAAAGIDEDRFEALLSIVEQRAGQGRLHEAWSSLRTLLRQPLSPAQRAVAVAVEASLERALEAAGARWLALLRAGRVLAVRAEFTAAGHDAGAYQQALESALTSAGAAPPADREELPEAELLPAPTALPRGRAVRFVLHDQLVSGVVVDSRSEAVTVRHATADGQSFPTLARWLVEPIAPTREEAVEAAIAARRAGEEVLARLWLAVARLQGGVASRREELAARGL